MNLKSFTHLLFALFVFFPQLNISGQNVELTTQAQVNAFTGTKVNGYLLIRGNDITDLSPLNTIDTVTHSIFIEYNRKLKVLNGFDNLVFNGGSLIIESNTELDSIGTFGKLVMNKGPLVLRDNPLLRECCAFYPLITGTQGVIWGGTIISGNKGCKSEKDLKENCDADSDNDGVDDSNDACPTDSLKINPGFCGCGIAETDSDQDGTPDCKDECPNDSNKILKGDCGCGKEETDADNDGVSDCKDDCPNNPNITEVGSCGCTNPRILSIRVGNIGDCDDNGTATKLDDTYSVDITINLEFVPKSGTLLITGGTNESISFSSFSTAKSYTIFGAAFKANGELIEVIAKFDGSNNCTKRNVFGIFGPNSCSTGACDPPSNSNADTENYENGVLLTWTDLGIGIEYEISYRPVGNPDWETKSAKTNQLFINGLLDYTRYEYRIRSYCDSEKYSDYLLGQFTTGGAVCKLIRTEVQNINCQDNQTPNDSSDDYFTFNLYVEGTSVGDNFFVSNVAGNNIGTYNSINTFATNSGTLGQGDITITISDSADENCKTAVTVTNPGMCSNDCQINYITVDTIYKCYDRGSRWRTADDYFTADITVNFTNAPASGELKLAGNVRGKISTENLQAINSYTFKKVRIPATGKDFLVGAEFTNGIDCIYSADFKGLLIKDDEICKDKCNIMNVQVRNVQCVDNNTDHVSDDYLTFELITTGINLTGAYHLSGVAGINKGTYNEPSFFRLNSGINTQIIDLKITDEDDSSCQFSIALENKCVSQLRISGNYNTNLGNSSKNLTVYPNPTRTTLFIDYPKTSETIFVEVFDLLGQKIIRQQLNENTLNVGHLPKGIYHLVIREGANFQTKKFIKE